MVASGYFTKIHSRNSSFYAAIFTVVIHLVIATIFVCKNRVQHIFIKPHSSLHMIEPRIDISGMVTTLQPPTIIFRSGYIDIALPPLDFQQPEYANLTRSYLQSNDLLYELPSETSDQYKDVFDPKLRKKLIDAQSLNVARLAEKQKRWTASDGTVFMDDGDGNCRNSMTNIDTHSAATNWSTLTLNVPCSKNDGGRMMDNVNADLEARKHPLNKKGQQ